MSDDEVDPSAAAQHNEGDPPPAAELDSPDVPKSYYLPIKPSELVFVNSKSLPEFVNFVSLTHSKVTALTLPFLCCSQ